MTTSWPASSPLTTSRRCGATPRGPDADALAARARDWLGQAAERATSLGSPDQALVFAEQALEITPAGAERVELLRRAARAAGDALRHEQQFGYLREAIEELHDLGDLERRGGRHGDLVQALADPNRWDEIQVVGRSSRRGWATAATTLPGPSRPRDRVCRYFEGDIEAASPRSTVPCPATKGRAPGTGSRRR